MNEFILIVTLTVAGANGPELMGFTNDDPSNVFFESHEACVEYAESYSTEERVNKTFDQYEQIQKIEMSCLKLDSGLVYER